MHQSAALVKLREREALKSPWVRAKTSRTTLAPSNPARIAFGAGMEVPDVEAARRPSTRASEVEIALLWTLSTRSSCESVAAVSRLTYQWMSVVAGIIGLALRFGA